MKPNALHSYAVTATLHPRNANGGHSSDTREETTLVNARNRIAAMNEARAAFERACPMPYGFALTFHKVNRVGDKRAYLALSPGSSARGTDMGRTSLLPIGDGSLKFHLLRLRLDSGGYDAGGAYWGHGKPLYRAVSAVKLPTAYRIGASLDPVSTGEIGHVERFTRAASRAEAKADIREAIPGATFFR